MIDEAKVREDYEIARHRLHIRRDLLRKATEEYERAAFALLDAIEPQPGALRRTG
jgi:hypothetical protein